MNLRCNWCLDGVGIWDENGEEILSVCLNVSLMFMCKVKEGDVILGSPSGQMVFNAMKLDEIIKRLNDMKVKRLKIGNLEAPAIKVGGDK